MGAEQKRWLLPTRITELPAVFATKAHALDPVIGFSNRESGTVERVSSDDRWQQIGIDGCIDLIAWTHHVAPVDRGVPKIELQALG